MTWCYFGIHKWGKWSEPVVHVKRLVRFSDGKRFSIKGQGQVKTCIKCGKTEGRVL